MLESAPVIGFIPSLDFARAHAFYVGLLGLTLISEDAFALELRANGATIRIVKVPEFTPLPFTLLGWRVPEIVSAVRMLAARGLTFERYPWFQQDEDGIWTSPDGTKVAWFRDPDGNTLSLSEHPE